MRIAFHDGVQRLMARARGPKKLWLIAASYHRFSGNEAEFDRTLNEAFGWIGSLDGRPDTSPVTAAR